MLCYSVKEKSAHHCTWLSTCISKPVLFDIQHLKDLSLIDVHSHLKLIHICAHALFVSLFSLSSPPSQASLPFVLAYSMWYTCHVNTGISRDFCYYSAVHLLGAR